MRESTLSRKMLFQSHTALLCVVCTTPRELKLSANDPTLLQLCPMFFSPEHFQHLLTCKSSRAIKSGTMPPPPLVFLFYCVLSKNGPEVIHLILRLIALLAPSMIHRSLLLYRVRLTLAGQTCSETSSALIGQRFILNMIPLHQLNVKILRYPRLPAPSELFKIIASPYFGQVEIKFCTKTMLRVSQLSTLHSIMISPRCIRFAQHSLTTLEATFKFHLQIFTNRHPANAPDGYVLFAL